MKTIARPHIDCSVEDCTKNIHANGMCNTHNKRLKRTGTTDANTAQKPPCSVEGCDRVHWSRGFCNMHYKRWLRRGDVGPAGKTELTTQQHCNVDGCEEPHRSRGYCDGHYFRLRRHGDPLGKGPLPLAEVIKLRRLVGVPDDGPAPEDRKRYAEGEARA